jgi:hypothetical protein
MAESVKLGTLRAVVFPFLLVILKFIISHWLPRIWPFSLSPNSPPRHNIPQQTGWRPAVHAFKCRKA